MKKSKQLLTALMLSLGVGTVAAAGADEPTRSNSPYLFEAVQKDAALKAAFAQAIEPELSTSPWLSEYGVASPAVSQTIDNVQYQIYSGCKPHDCPSESYAVMYDPQSQRIVAGAVVRNHFDQNQLGQSTVQWLGQTDWDQARALSHYLF